MTFSRAKAALAGSRFSDLRWSAETGSTNADALDALRAAVATEPDRVVDLVVVADHQSAGRGRQGRTWEAPPASSLLMTVATTQAVPDSSRALMLTALTLAARDACRTVAGVDTSLKWPNDLVARTPEGDERKVGGVLAEALPLPDGQIGAAVGIGLNCNWGAIPEDLAAIATSLDLLVGDIVDREDLAVAVIEGFTVNLEHLRTDHGRAHLVMEAAAHSATLGREVRVELARPGGKTSVLEGLALELDADGALVVETEAGERHVVVVGDVIHLRPR